MGEWVNLGNILTVGTWKASLTSGLCPRCGSNRSGVAWGSLTNRHLPLCLDLKEVVEKGDQGNLISLCLFPQLLHYFPSPTYCILNLLNILTPYYLFPSFRVSAPWGQGFSQTPLCLAHSPSFIILDLSGNIWKLLLLENVVKEKMVEGSWERVLLSLLIKLALGQSGCSTVKDNWYAPLQWLRVWLQIIFLPCPDYDSQGLYHKLKEGHFFSPSHG